MTSATIPIRDCPIVIRPSVEKSHCSSKILPQPHDPAQDTLLFRHGKVFIPPVEWMENSLPADFLKLPQEGPFWAAVFTLGYHVMTRLTGKIRIDENDLAFTEEGLHGIVSHLHGEGTLPWNVGFEQCFSVDETRRLFARNHLVNLIPPQKWHLPHRAEGGGMGVLCEVEQSL
jgi:hypothetical protein